ncbi:substrate-binding domain-containing protein [Lysinibacter cavernae]|uniref:Ribose transport system substrate-binding protein n=1 Tax=Lysinibacter cavernae TaxID=1640652 RepID=A0A7X5R3T7_9MICO|nr:ribose transport system substrate-binding protein [Lysinibacter cavernae]
MTKTRIQKSLGAIALSASALLLFTGCANNGNGGESNADGDSYNVAVLAASSQNGYNQAVYKGVEDYAKTLDKKVNLTLLDGQFNSETQLSQLQNVTGDSQYDGVIVVPNDGPTLAAAFPTVNEIPVVAVLNPIGPDIDKMEAQVEGVVSTVAVPPSDAATTQAELVVDYCKDIDPCKVALLVGNLSATLDVARRDAYREVLDSEKNIEIVSELEGNYDRDKSLTAVSNMLQSTPDVNVILSNADQQTTGAQIALENAGIEPSSVYLTGGGGTTGAVTAVRDGIWQADYLNFPVSMGSAALEQLINSLEGKDVKAVVDADAVGGMDAFVTKETLDETPDFTGEWDG